MVCVGSRTTGASELASGSEPPDGAITELATIGSSMHLCCVIWGLTLAYQTRAVTVRGRFCQTVAIIVVLRSILFDRHVMRLRRRRFCLRVRSGLDRMKPCGYYAHIASLFEGNTMSNQTQTREEEATAVPAETKSGQQIMNQVVGAVRQDSQAAANVYLEETTVPNGGE